jgi:predicted Fe-Mo cluster-binding NifX family protein
MKFAVPLDSMLTLYHHNPCTAPKFGIYSVREEAKEVYYRLIGLADNPWRDQDSRCERHEKNCKDEDRKSLQHRLEHYALLEAVGGCSYLLAQHFCANTKRAMKNAGIRVFGIPPFIKETDRAIKNFLIGAEIADTVEHIHNAS